MRLGALVLAVLVVGCGGETETTVTRTVTTTETVAAEGGLPTPVAEKRDALLAAAESGDYEELRPLVPKQFSYTFGGPFQGGPIAYWEMVERETGDRPIAILADLLRLPYTLYQGIYTWPFAFDKQANELSEYERSLLRDAGGENLSDDFGVGTGYLGWRVGIDPDGDWIFFIAGD